MTSTHGSPLKRFECRRLSASCFIEQTFQVLGGRITTPCYVLVWPNQCERGRIKVSRSRCLQLDDSKGDSESRSGSGKCGLVSSATFFHHEQREARTEQVVERS